MSNLPLQSAVIHNDDNDEQNNPSINKFSTLNSRITSPLIIKRQQNIETEIANNQAYDEIHDLQPKHSSIKKTNNDHLNQYNQTKSNSSHDLMQGNYYDQTRYDLNSSSSNHLSDPQLIHINVDEYKKTIAPNSIGKNNTNKTRSSSPPFGHTSESIQQGIAQSAGILLELNKKQHQPKHSMKNNYKSHERAVIDYHLSNDNETNKQRSLSSSSSSSSSPDCSASDSSSSNKSQGEREKTNIPYEKLTNDEDEDDENNERLTEQIKKPATESTAFLNKTTPQTYGTQSINERSKYLANNGYNSHGSSITTKSSSDNSGSVRTNSGSDNDEESDEEHYNNSTVSNNSHSTSSKSTNKPNDIHYSYSNEQNSYQSERSNTSRSEQIGNNDEHHLQVPRLKQLPNDDLNSNSNLNKLNSGTDYTTLPYTSKWPLQQSSVNQTNTLSSSSHQNRNLVELQEQQQQQYHSNLSRNNSRQHQTRTTKKRKQSQLQETIRTELIPGHRGDLDVDELVMFIDGNPPKQRQNSASVHSTDTTKSKLNPLNDLNSNKATVRKKSRKPTKILQQSISITDDHENDTSLYVTSNEQNLETNSLNDEEQTNTHSIVDITNQSLEHRHLSSSSAITTTTTSNEQHSDTVNSTTIDMTNGKTSLPNWFEQTRNLCPPNEDHNSFSLLSSTIANNSNSEPISEPFVTVTHRRRLIKERRQDNNSSSARSFRFSPASAAMPPPPSSSYSSNNNDKRRIPSVTQNGMSRLYAHQNLSNNNKPMNSSISIEETKNKNNDNNNNNNNNTNNNSVISESVSRQSPLVSTSSSTVINPPHDLTLEKRQSSPRLSSHSSSSSLSSLIKRQSKPPPVVFLNKSVDVELNDVSFGFDLDSTPLNISSDETNEKSSTNDLHPEPTNTSILPTTESTESTYSETEKSPRKSQQRNYRGSQFYSGSDIRPHHHRTYPSQPLPPQSSYIDPLLFLQYNQQRLASYSHPLAYMNLIRGQYVTPQSQYVYLPTNYPNTVTVPNTTTPTSTTTTNETDDNEEINQTSSEQVLEPVVVFTTPTGQLCYHHPSMNKKSYVDSDQQQQQSQSTSIPTVYPAASTVYLPHYFYPPQAQHLISSHPAFFQPITSSSSSLIIDTKSEQNDIDDADLDDADCDKSTKAYLQTRQQTSSDIMSNALQLVYSQQRRNAQTDRFNLDDLTAYLAMKWTDTVDHYEQGDNRILLVDE